MSDYATDRETQLVEVRLRAETSFARNLVDGLTATLDLVESGLAKKLTVSKGIPPTSAAAESRRLCDAIVVADARLGSTEIVLDLMDVLRLALDVQTTIGAYVLVREWIAFGLDRMRRDNLIRYVDLVVDDDGASYRIGPRGRRRTGKRGTAGAPIVIDRHATSVDPDTLRSFLRSTKDSKRTHIEVGYRKDQPYFSITVERDD